MNAIRTLSSLCLIPALLCGYAQTGGKPVLSATPVPASEAAAPAAAPAAGPEDPNTYVIGPDDSLQITVWKEPQLSGTIPVRPDGMITLPLINDIKAAGYTPMQLRADITARLKKDGGVLDPVVDVSVLAVNSKRIYMVGEIGHVGPLALAPGMTILQAIATAGGLTPYAQRKKIYILRGDAAHQKKIPFDYDKAKKGDMQGITLQPGDTIFFP